jgi:hypothetical protein
LVVDKESAVWDTEAVETSYDPPPVTQSHVHRLYVLFALLLLLIVAFLSGIQSNKSHKQVAGDKLVPSVAASEDHN